MFYYIRLAVLAALLTTPVSAQVPILEVPPAVPATSEADRSDPAAWQAAMPSIAIAAAFLAEKEERGPENEHIPRADNSYGFAEEVYFYVSLDNVARDPVAEADAAFAIALRAQVRAEDGTPLSDWLEVHTYTGTMSMPPDHPEYYQNWVTGGLGPEVPPGRYQLALEFTDMSRAENASRAPVEVVFDLLYPDQ
ncbi:hypothetical protein V8J82_14435 [Gymnodinialimonas sp. 2305UL16-5]|uniref:hypothetical protein n=1 Tax=Gymnodinialimonas mytili TaxID=3126503 RepID=UPI0030B507D6